MTEQQAKDGLNILKHSDEWEMALKISIGKPDYWSEVRLCFLKLGGKYYPHSKEYQEILLSKINACKGTTLLLIFVIGPLSALISSTLCYAVVMIIVLVYCRWSFLETKIELPNFWLR